MILSAMFRSSSFVITFLQIQHLSAFQKYHHSSSFYNPQLHKYVSYHINSHICSSVVEYSVCTRIMMSTTPPIEKEDIVEPVDDNSPTKNKTSNEIEDVLEDLGLPRPLVLGSGSFTRKLILKEMAVPFVTIVRSIDEKSIGSNLRTSFPTTVGAASELVTKLAYAKMEHLIEQIQSGDCLNDGIPPSLSKNFESVKSHEICYNEYIILTADQVVLCNGHILEKPESIVQAIEYVSSYGTHPCSTVGAVCIAHLPSKIQIHDVHIATIYFKSSITNEAPQIVSDMMPTVLSCAGGLMIENPSVEPYIDRIDGTIDSVMGLSKETVRKLFIQIREKIQLLK